MLCITKKHKKMNINNEKSMDALISFLLSSDYSKDEKDAFAKDFIKQSISSFNTNTDKHSFAESVSACAGWLYNDPKPELDQEITTLYETLFSRAIANNNGAISNENLQELNQNDEFFHTINDLSM